MFSDNRLWFCYLDVFADILRENSFSIVVMNASFQYFPHTEKIIERCLSLLQSGGELHIIDTPFYDREKCEAARQRSADYFQQQGFGLMSAHYYHHARDVLEAYSPHYLYDPTSLPEDEKGKDMPFPWVRITA